MDTKEISSKLVEKGAAPTPSSFEHHVREWFKSNGPKMATLAGSKEEAQKILVAAVNSVSKNYKLLECEFSTFATCLLTSATLRLYPGPLQECAYVPLWNSKTKRSEANFWPMYPGLLKLAYNSGFVKSVSTTVVWAADLFDYEEGDKPRLKHKPYIGPRANRGERYGVYAIVNLTSGGVHRQFVSADTVEGIRASSPGAKSADSVWNSTNPDKVDWMWRKTALKQALKSVPRSAELAEALRLDDAIDISEPKEEPKQVDMSSLLKDINGPGLDQKMQDPEKSIKANVKLPTDPIEGLGLQIEIPDDADIDADIDIDFGDKR